MLERQREGISRAKAEGKYKGRPTHVRYVFEVSFNSGDRVTMTNGVAPGLEVKMRRLHPVPVRIMHWINAVAMIIMITSGWGIYDDYVVISGLHFSQSLRLGDWAAESLLCDEPREKVAWGYTYEWPFSITVFEKSPISSHGLESEYRCLTAM
jgi:hypothetical protein